MKNIILFITLAVIIAFTSVSCKHSNREQRLAKADSLAIALGRVDTMLNIDLKYDSIVTKFNKIKENQEKLSIVISKLNQKEKSDYLQYISSEKQFKNIIANYDKYKNELEYSKKQIADLKKDFEKRIIKKDKFDEYIKTEEKAVYSLLNNVKSEVFRTKKHFEKFNTFNSAIEELLEKKGLKEKTSAKKSEGQESAEEDD